MNEGLPPLELPEGSKTHLFWCPVCQRPASGYVSPAALNASDLGQALALMSDTHRQIDLCEKHLWFEVRPVPVGVFATFVFKTARPVWGSGPDLRMILDAWIRSLPKEPTGWVRVVCDTCGFCIGVADAQTEREELEAVANCKDAHRATSTCKAERGHFQTIPRGEAGHLMVNLVEANRRRKRPSILPDQPPPGAAPVPRPPADPNLN